MIGVSDDSTSPLARYLQPGEDKRIRARAVGRVAILHNHSVVTIRRTFLAWLLAAIWKFIVVVIFRRKYAKVPNSVEFYAQGVEKLKWRNPWLIFPGRLVIEAPAGSGDRWRRSGREKPHRLRFGGRRRRAKMLILAWAINFSAQRWGGAPLGKLPPLEDVPPPWWSKPLRLAMAIVGAPTPADVLELADVAADIVDAK